MVMATSKPISPPARPANMTREEAETVTKQIKQNFDSLGNMLLAAREQKAYKVLGYRSFESYCQSEFGKSSSTAYQAIEDAKVRSQLEARISENYGEDVTLKFPSSHLRPLKVVEGIDDKLKAITYAQKLAESENKKPTKKHLELAVFEITGHCSEDFRKAINELGFTPGTSVETQKPLKTERGVVKRVDKSGKIYVELYYGSNQAIDFDATQLRILKDGEKPANPLEGSVASKGDRVLIYAEGLQGKQGTIYTWKEDKTTLVMVDGETTPTIVAYAEMELLKPEKKNTNWEADLSWDTGRQTYYYFQKEDKIYSRQWPAGLSLTPYSHELNPIEFMADWEKNFAGSVLEALANPANLKTLVLAQAIELPEEEGKEFVADLIASLNQLFLQAPKTPKAMGISFSRTINELKSGKKTQTRRAWQDDYAKNFIRYFDENIAIPALDKGRHRGGCELGFIKLTQRPYQQYLSEMSLADLQEEGGMVGTVQEFIDTYFEGQDRLVWVLHFDFLATPNTNITDTLVAENERLREQLTEAEAVIEAMVNTSCTALTLGLAQNSDFLLENTEEISTPGETAPGSEFLLENTSEISTPGETAPHPNSWRQLLANNGFAPVPYELDGFYKGSWRGWKLFFHTPNGGVTAIDIANEKEEMFARCTEIDFDINLDNEEAIINWTKGIINQVEDFCPGQLAFDFGAEENVTSELPPEIVERIASERQILLDRVEHYKQSLSQAPKKQIPNIEKQIEVLRSQLRDLDRLEEFRIGQSVCHQKRPMILGKITGFDFSVGGMATIWLRYFQDGELKETTDQELLHMIFRVDI